MPKPLLLQRKSGLYVRFFVPTDLQKGWGSRYVVRSLQGQRSDQARLTIAKIGYVLGVVFRTSRIDPMADPKDLFQTAMQALQSGTGRDYTLELPNGVKIQADSPDDHARAMEALEKFGQLNPQASTPPKPVGLLSERVQVFLKQMKTKERSATNLLDTTFTLSLFLALVGDKELAEISTDDTDKFLDALAHWPANASKKKAYRGLPPQDVVAKAKLSGDKGLAPRTKEKHLDRLRTFFNYCIARRLLDFNPVQGLSITNKEQDETSSRLPFDGSDLAKIFDPSNWVFTQPHKHWAPILAVYTGARVNEIAQLYVEDIEHVQEIWGLHINRRFNGQKLKNSHSRRFIPLHTDLLKLGFLDYVQDVKKAGFKHLFPGLSWGVNGPGDTVGDWFNRTYLRKTCGILDRAKSFHSFRHTFASLAERSGLSDQRIARLTGHSAGNSVLRQHYIQPSTLVERATDIASIQFPTWELNRRPKGFFNPWLQRVKAVERRKLQEQARNGGEP